MRQTILAWQLGPGTRWVLLPTCLFLSLLSIPICWSQDAEKSSGSDGGKYLSGKAVNSPGPHAAGTLPDLSKPEKLAAWLGLPVREIGFEGVQQSRLEPLASHLPQAVNAPLDRELVAQSLRQLFGTGLFRTLDADVSQKDDGVKLIFKGAPSTFIGVVTVSGAKGATMNAQLMAVSRLNAGSRFSERR